jgi:murein tripeptide amidase MpaA
MIGILPTACTASPDEETMTRNEKAMRRRNRVRTVAVAPLRALWMAAIAVALSHSALAAQAVLPGDEPNGPYPGYWSWPAMVQKVYEYQRDYPDLVQVHTIGRSHEGRDILAVKVTANVAAEDSVKPELLYMAGIHPREQQPQIGVMRFMEELVTTYGTDPRVTRLVDSRVIWFIPVYNVDGKVHDFKFGNGTTRGANWRTNREPFGDRYGVDLNRNNPVGWGSASDEPGTQTYHGPGPASTPESQVLSTFLASRPFRVFLDIHSTSRAYLFPGHMIREESDRYRWLIQGLKTRQSEPYGGNPRVAETQAGDNSGTGVGQTHVMGLYMYGAYSIIYELGPGNFYAPPDSIVTHYERNIREPWFFLLEEAVNLPPMRHGDFSVKGATFSAPLAPGTRVEWRPEIEGDVAYGVLISLNSAIRVTGDYKLLPLNGSGYMLNVAEGAVPGSVVPMQLYLWDRERRRSVVDFTVTVGG